MASIVAEESRLGTCFGIPVAKQGQGSDVIVNGRPLHELLHAVDRSDAQFFRGLTGCLL